MRFLVTAAFVAGLAACGGADASGATPPPEPGSVSEQDVELFNALVAFAREPSADTLSDVPLADEVWLGLGTDLLVKRARADLVDPAAWLLDKEAFRGYVGPFSALERLSQDRESAIAIGPHPHCASPPVPAPEPVADLRRVSVQPTDGDSCLQWWTVDAFVGEEGIVAAITLDLWEP